MQPDKSRSAEDIKKAVNYAHKLNKKVYITVNIAMHNKELKGIKKYLKQLDLIKVDAIIISDPAIIEIAKKEGFKYIAEGARISQKFMLEQIPITNRLKELAESQGIKLLLPVLYVNDDQQEIEELLTNGYSSKTWESKCLIGKPAKDKTDEDKIAIIDYSDLVLKPNILKKIK
mgnify:CR=1 FL=1